MAAENSHQILLVRDPVASAAAQAWLKSLGGKGGKAGGGKGGGGSGGGTPRSRL